MSDSDLKYRISVWGARALHTLFVLALLAGCTVGPDFAPLPQPEVPVRPPPSVSFEAARSCKASNSQEGRFCIAQRLVGGRDVPGAWWMLFHSRALNDLMERTLEENHDLKAAQAALRAAHANYEAQRGALFPVVDLNYLPSRQKVASRDFSAPTWSLLPYYTLHTAQLTISYVPDVFGGIRRQIEVSAAQEDLQQFMLEATYLTLTSNLALAAIQEASLRQQIEVTKRAISEEKILRDSKLSRSRADMSAVEAGISQAQQTLPLLAKQLTVQRDLLAALSGQFAGFGVREEFFLKDMLLPRDLPVSLSSQIVEQRPDVRAAEANLHAAMAAVGVAIANRLPQFNLYGNAGLMSSQFKYLFNSNPQFIFWTLAANVTQTIFDGFTLEQRQRAAEAGWDQAAEQYQTTVVNAFQNVADALQAIERDKEVVRWALEAKDAAVRNRCLTIAVFVKWDGNDPVNLKAPRSEWPKLIDWWRQNCARRVKPPYFEGDEDKNGSDVLVAEQLYLSSQIALVQAEATRLSDVVALFQALGGGWWNRTDTAPSEPPAVLVAAPPNRSRPPAGEEIGPVGATRSGG
jgi:NodT family efflux transporter outer membrane factor (OMF) lipoprotein